MNAGINVLKKEKMLDSAIHEVQLFGNYVNLQIKRVWALIKETNLENALKNILSIKECIALFRINYIARIKKGQDYCDSKFAKSYLWVDEYISGRLLKLCLRIDEPSLTISTIISNESLYQQENFKNFDLENNIKEREKYYYRQGTLKKFVHKCLHLSSKQVKKEAIYKNIFAGIAAALAATAANLNRLEGGLARGANDYGLKFFVMLFFGVMVYVFKDRIKDLSKEYFNKRLKNKLPDTETHFSYKIPMQNGETNNIQMGIFQEFIRYFKKQEIPEQVHFLRKLILRKGLTPPEGKVIINYSKKVWFNRNALPEIQGNRIYLKDIFRFNVHDFLPFFDNPSKELSIFEEDKGTQIFEAPKIYYFDFILQVSKKRTGDKPGTEIALESFRLVLSKNGIIRVDQLVEKGKFNYLEEQNGN